MEMTPDYQILELMDCALRNLQPGGNPVILDLPNTTLPTSDGSTRVISLLWANSLKKGDLAWLDMGFRVDPEHLEEQRYREPDFKIIETTFEAVINQAGFSKKIAADDVSEKNCCFEAKFRGIDQAGPEEISGEYTLIFDVKKLQLLLGAINVLKVKTRGEPGIEPVQEPPKAGKLPETIMGRHGKHAIVIPGPNGYSRN